MNPAQASVLLKALEFGIFMAQFSAERQRRMREQVAAIPASTPPLEVDLAFERIAAEALDESQASIDRARAVLKPTS